MKVSVWGDGAEELAQRMERMGHTIFDRDPCINRPAEVSVVLLTEQHWPLFAKEAGWKLARGSSQTVPVLMVSSIPGFCLLRGVQPLSCSDAELNAVLLETRALEK